MKMYLREMGLVSLLSREGEVEIAKKIEEGARETMWAIFRLSVSINEVLSIGEKLETGEIRIKNVVDNIEDEEGFMEEDEHKERVLKLIARITDYLTTAIMYCAKNSNRKHESQAARIVNGGDRKKHKKYYHALPKNTFQQKADASFCCSLAILYR